MTDNIVNLDDHRPHVAAYVACLDCGKIGSLLHLPTPCTLSAQPAPRCLVL
jgi:hypothetical protein